MSFHNVEGADRRQPVDVADEIRAPDEIRRLIDVVAFTAFASDVARETAGAKLAIMLFETSGMQCREIMRVRMPGSPLKLFARCEKKAYAVVDAGSDPHAPEPFSCGAFFAPSSAMAMPFVFGDEDGVARTGLAVACGLKKDEANLRCLRVGLDAVGKVHPNIQGVETHHLFTAATNAQRRLVLTIT